MTKKDFILIADALYESKPSHYLPDPEATLRLNEWECIVATLTDALAEECPKFKQEIFTARCYGPSSKPRAIRNKSV